MSPRCRRHYKVVMWSFSFFLIFNVEEQALAILIASVAIGLMTLLITLGVMIGRVVGKAVGKRPELLGGLALMGVGAGILYEHLTM